MEKDITKFAEDALPFRRGLAIFCSAMVILSHSSATEQVSGAVNIATSKNVRLLSAIEILYSSSPVCI